MRKIIKYSASFILLLFVVAVIEFLIAAFSYSLKYRDHFAWDGKIIYVVNHGWHSSIVVFADDIDESIIPEKEHLPNSRFIEIGWGDAGFYQADEISSVLAVKALFTNTQSVMHLVGFNRDVVDYFPNSSVTGLVIKDTDFQKMLKDISASFKRHNNQPSLPIKKGLYGNSFFYHANGYYNLSKTCNNWTAIMLQSSGMPLRNWLSSTSDGVMIQLYIMKYLKLLS